VWREYRDRGVAFLAVATAEMGPVDRDETRRWAKNMGLTMPVALDLTVETYRRYDPLAGANRVAPFPRQFVVDRQGRLLYGSRRYDAVALRRALDAALR